MRDVNENIPMVSVVVICYNQAPYICACLDGIFMQKVDFPYEVKVYDDASTDGTVDILRQYAEAHSNLELNLYKENNFSKGKAYYGEKQGYITAKGKYVATCEGDDYWTDPLKLQKQVDFMEGHPEYSVVYHRFAIYQELYDKWETDGMDDLFADGKDYVELTTELFLSRWVTQYVTMMFRRVAYIPRKIDRYNLFRDSQLFYSLLQEGHGAILSSVAGVYRRTGTGIYTHMQLQHKLESHIAVAKEMWELNPHDKRLKFPYTKALQHHIDSTKENAEYRKKNLRYANTLLFKTGNVKKYIKNIIAICDMRKYIDKIERFMLRAINRVVYGGNPKPKRILQISGDVLNDVIFQGLTGSDPFMVARFGSAELDAALYPYICSLPLKQRYKLYAQKKVKFLRYSSSYAEYIMRPFCNNAGFFPNDTSMMGRYKERLLGKDAPCCDILCCSEWIREDLAEPFLNRDVRYASIAEMEPYDYAQPWSRALTGKKVLVVHPFAETIEKQYQKRELLWENKEVLPEFELHTIKAVQSIAGEEVPFNDWFEALHHMEEQMDAIDYDIAIIGCGAYGFSLAAHAKRMGKKAVHLGGATQILFGIKGKRWDELPEVSKFYNEHWVYPSAADTPKHKDRVENGCYW